MNQRWRSGRDSYRPPQERIDPRRYEVAEIPDDRTAKDFVARHHYARSYPSARFRFGMYEGGTLVGVAVASHPVNDRVLTSVFPGEATESVELGRFVLVDQVPGNGETWFLARAFELLRKHAIIGVLSFSDPVPRTTADRRVVKPGHVGSIYQAHNGRFLGRGDARILRLLPDGTVFSHRTEQKIRRLEQGWRYGVQLLVRHGADELRAGENPESWLASWLPRLTRRLRHPGNLRYAWPLDRAVARCLARSMPYRKEPDPMVVVPA